MSSVNARIILVDLIVVSYDVLYFLWLDNFNLIAVLAVCQWIQAFGLERGRVLFWQGDGGQPSHLCLIHHLQATKPVLEYEYQTSHLYRLHHSYSGVCLCVLAPVVSVCVI